MWDDVVFDGKSALRTVVAARHMGAGMLPKKRSSGNGWMDWMCLGKSAWWVC